MQECLIAASLTSRYAASAAHTAVQQRSMHKEALNRHSAHLHRYGTKSKAWVCVLLEITN